MLAGVDLLIPAEHFVSGEHADRAMSAMLDAIAFAAEMHTLCAQGRGTGRVVVCQLPAELPVTLARAIEAAAAQVEVAVGELGVASLPVRGSAMGIAFDPATALSAGLDVVGETAKLSGRLVAARWSDMSSAGRVVPPSSRRYDTAMYRATLATVGFTGPVVLDLRGVERQERAASSALEAWRSAAAALPGVSPAR